MSDWGTRELIKALVAEGAIALVAIYAFLDALKINRGRRAMAAALVLLSVVSVFAYFEFGQKRFNRYMNPHDVYHYYLGSKYTGELQYTGLYEASLVADRELGARVNQNGRIRDLNNHKYVSVRDTLARSEEIKDRFSPQRWEAFKEDVEYFRAAVPRSKWESMLKDKGYNGTPVWGTVASAFSNMMPTSSAGGMFLLVLLDPLMLAVMFGFLWWAFGWRAMLLAVVFFGTNFTMSFVHAKGGFLRLDWVACTVVSMCLVKKDRYKTAGGVFAYAAAARVFPLVFAFGLGAIGLWQLLSKRQINRQIAGFFLVFALVSTALVGSSAAIYGTGLWQEFSDKISVHNSDISTTRVGFKYFFVRSAENSADKAAMFEEQHTTWLAIQAVVLLLTFIGAARLKPYQAMALGFVPAYFLTSPTFYYYMMLVIPLLLFLPDFASLRRAIGLSLFFAFSVIGYVLHRFHNLGYDLSYYLSAMLLCLCVYMVFYALPAIRVPAFAGRRRPWGLPASVASGVVLGIACGALLNFRSGGDTPVAPAASGADSGAAVSGPVPPAGMARIVFGGDVMLSRNVEKSIRDNDRTFRYPFAEIAPFIRDSEIAFCNLECPVSGRGEAISKRYLFNAPPHSVTGLLRARFDVVSLANNHILDYGLTALKDTERHLESANIAHAGITDGNEPQVPVILDRNGVRVGFLAYTDPASPYGTAKEFRDFATGPALATEENLTRDIAALSPNCDVVVVSLHWGVEYEPEPRDDQRALARFIIDEGADVVVGHHPHVQQAIETYAGGVIMYSLGNLVFDQWSRPPTREAKLVRVTVSKTDGVQQIEELPATIIRNDWQTLPDVPAYVPWTAEAAPAVAPAVGR